MIFWAYRPDSSSCATGFNINLFAGPLRSLGSGGNDLHQHFGQRQDLPLVVVDHVFLLLLVNGISFVISAPLRPQCWDQSSDGDNLKYLREHVAIFFGTSCRHSSFVQVKLQCLLRVP